MAPPSGIRLHRASKLRTLRKRSHACIVEPALTLILRSVVARDIAQIMPHVACEMCLRPNVADKLRTLQKHEIISLSGLQQSDTSVQPSAYSPKLDTEPSSRKLLVLVVSLFPIPYSLFPIPYSPFPVHLTPVRYIAITIDGG